MSDFNDFLKQTKRKVLDNSVKCPVCSSWLLKTGIDRHIRIQHPEEYKLIKEDYYKMVEEWKQ